MGNSSTESNNSDSSGEELHRQLRKLKRKFKKLKKSAKKRKRRSRSISSSRSGNGRQNSRSRSRSRARPSSHRGSPARYYDRDYRSPSGCESPQPRHDLTDSDGGPDDDTQPGGAAPHRNGPVANSRENEPPDGVSNDTVLEIHDNENIAAEWLQLLGDDPKNSEAHAFQLHAAVSSRWNNIISNGLKIETKEELEKKYPLPSNCEMLAPLQVNTEVLNILPNFHIKRDRSHPDMQTRLCKGMSALGQGISLLLEGNEIPKEQKERLLSCLGDSGKIFADLVHHSTNLRRTLLLPQMSKSAREMAEKTVPGTYLFGADFGEKIKELKVMERTSKDLKLPSPTTSRQATQFKRPAKEGGGKSQRYRPLPTLPKENLNRGRPTRRQKEARSRKGYPSRAGTNYHWRSH